MTTIRLADLRRLVSTLVALVVIGTAAAACTPSTGPTEPTQTPGETTSAPPTTTGQPPTKDAMRTRLAEALRPTSPALATLVDNERSTLAEIKSPWLTGWQLIDVLNQAPPRPRRFVAALSADGSAVVLSGQPASYRALSDEGVITVDSAATAVAVGETYLDVTRDFVKASYRISAIDEVKWIPNQTPAEKAAREELLTSYEERIAAAKPSKVEDGWSYVLWTVTGEDLVQHSVTVATDGRVSDERTVVEKGIPVPASI